MPVPSVSMIEVARPAAGADLPLGHRGRVAVVVDHGRHAEAVASDAARSTPSSGMWTEATTRRATWSTRDGTPTPIAATRPCSSSAADGLVERRQERVLRSTVGVGRSTELAHGAVRIDEPRGHLRATHVDADDGEGAHTRWLR